MLLSVIFNSYKNVHNYRNPLQFSSNKNKQGQYQVVIEIPPEFHDESTNVFGRSVTRCGIVTVTL